ncbi:cysteine and tyrosine-rich protein 1-like [Saccostrea echinata]|uniref:cysteine and tyrosine-rich protein 1-like n=1 Tax=Saccostrea echinata TaxID=191078 RepID=UPI002A7EDB49|nr:cysteine and tyrosine-rich protein 1-like [Saccostrea echinata]
MKSAIIIGLIFVSLSQTRANYCYYSYSYSRYYCSNDNSGYLDSRSIAGIVVGCVVALAVVIAAIVYCKKKDQNQTRVVEIRSNGTTQIHSITNFHPPPGPPGGYMHSYGGNPAYPPTGRFPPPFRPHLPGNIDGPPPAVFPPNNPPQYPGMPPPAS